MSRTDELAIAAQGGNEDARTELVKAMESRVLGIARSFSIKMQVSYDELYGDGLSAVASCIDKWDRNRTASFVTYASRCAKNAMLNTIRYSKTNYNAVPLSLVEENSLPIKKKWVPDNLDDLNGISPVADIAVKAIKKMSKSQRFIVLSVIQGKPLADIGDKYGIDELEVRRRLKTALEFIDFQIQMHAPEFRYGKKDDSPRPLLDL